MSGWFSTASKKEEAAVKARSPGCCARFVAELNPCQPWFLITDNGRKLDIPETFAPPTCTDFLLKLILTAITWFTLFWGIYDRDKPRAFFFAYFTNYGVIWASLYQGMSLLNTIFAARTGQPPERAGLRIRLTWLLFEIAGNWTLVAALLFWTAVYDPGTTNINYNTIVPHGGTALIVWIDGFYVNRIPCRWMHWTGAVMPAELAWIIWSVLHAYVFTDIGNPNKSDLDPDTNDDSIYSILDWKGDTLFVAVFAGACLFVLSPILFSFQWIVSLYGWRICCGKDIRRYVDRVYDANDGRPTLNDVEEGSIFQQYN